MVKTGKSTMTLWIVALITLKNFFDAVMFALLYLVFSPVLMSIPFVTKPGNQ